MKCCRKHFWSEEIVQVLMVPKTYPGAINWAFVKPIKVEICVKCGRIRNQKEKPQC